MCFSCPSKESKESKVPVCIGRVRVGGRQMQLVLTCQSQELLLYPRCVNQATLRDCLPNQQLSCLPLLCHHRFCRL